MGAPIPRPPPQCGFPDSANSVARFDMPHLRRHHRPSPVLASRCDSSCAHAGPIGGLPERWAFTARRCGGTWGWGEKRRSTRPVHRALRAMPATRMLVWQHRLSHRSRPQRVLITRGVTRPRRGPLGACADLSADTSLLIGQAALKDAS